MAVAWKLAAGLGFGIDEPQQPFHVVVAGRETR
jgi:hypothetical protein